MDQMEMEIGNGNPIGNGNEKATNGNLMTLSFVPLLN
jgi:hypothetical protein